MKPKPKPYEYLVVGLVCYLAAGVMAWAKSSFAPDFGDTITAFVYIFIALGTLGVIVAAVAQYLSSTGPNARHPSAFPRPPTGETAMYQVRLFVYVKFVNSQSAFCVALLNWQDTWTTICDTLAARDHNQALIFFMADCVSSLKAPSEVEITIADEAIAASTVTRRIHESEVEAWTDFGAALEAGGHKLTRDITGDPEHLLIQACAATADATSFISSDRALAALQATAPLLSKLEEQITEAGLFPWDVKLIRMRHTFRIVDNRIERFAGDPRSDGMRNMVTPDQLTRIRRLGRVIGLTGQSLELTCYDELGCETGDLNQFAAEWLIEYLTLEARAQSEEAAGGSYDNERVMESEDQPPAQATPTPRGFQTQRDAEGRVVFPENPVAGSMNDLVTPRQLGMIRALAREVGVGEDDECVMTMNCPAESLSKRAASAMIDHLKDMRQRSADYEAKSTDIASRGNAQGGGGLEYVTPKQMGLMRALAREAGVDLEEECQSKNKCYPNQLTKRGASTFIDHLKTLQPDPQQQQQQPSGAAA